MSVEREDGRKAPVPLRANRDYVVLRGGQFASQLGREMSFLAYPLLVLGLTRSPLAAGLVGTVRMGASYAGGAVGGPLVDHFDRRRLLIACEAGRAGALVLLGIAVLTGREDLSLILAVAGVGGALGALVGPGSSALVAQIVRPDQLDAAVAHNEAGAGMAGLVGPGVGGLLFGFGQAIPFLANAITYLCSVAGLVSLRARVPPPEEREPVDSWHQEALAGLRWITARRQVLVFLAVVSVLNLTTMGLDVLVLLRAREGGASSFAVGIAIALGGGGAVIGSLTAPWVIRRLGRPMAALLGLWTLVALVPLLGVVSGFVGLGLLFGGCAIAVLPVNVVVGAWLLRVVPDELRGRVLTAVSLVATGLGALGPALAAGLLVAVGRLSGLLLDLPLLVAVAAVTIAPSLRAVLGGGDR